MRATALILCSVVWLGCGDRNETTSDGTSTSTGDGSSSGGEVGGDPITTSGSTSTGETPTTSEGTSTGEPSASTGEPSATTGGQTTGGQTTGGGLECDAVTEGPVTPALFLSGFQGSEDLAFDGKGGLALKRDGDIVIVRADKTETILASDIPTAYGTRYLADGRLLVALPQGGAVLAVDGEGMSTDFVADLEGPNGVYPDASGAVWITEFGGARLVRFAADLSETTIVEGIEASSANGVVYDPLRGMAFYTNYQSGQVRRVAVDEQGVPGKPVLVTTIAGAAPDGLTLDACGNLYAVDQGNSVLYRVLLDPLGQALADAAELATFATNVANAQFGVGEGFDAHTLYVAGNPGDVYTVAIEFPGAPIVTVQ